MPLRPTSLVIAAVTFVMASTVALPAHAQASTSNAYEPMPNFVGMGRASVFSEMYSAQLYYKTQGPGANSTTWTRVVSEIPAAGTMIHPFSTVILQVTTTPVSVPVAVPATVKSTVKATVKLDAVTRSTPRPTSGPTSRPTTRQVAAASPSNERVGVATWYSYIPGQCATWFLPMGTRVSVQDLSNGHVISCVVTDHEASRGERVVDLNETQFAQLAPLGVGVVPVRVTW